MVTIHDILITQCSECGGEGGNLREFILECVLRKPQNYVSKQWVDETSSTRSQQV